MQAMHVDFNIGRWTLGVQRLPRLAVTHYFCELFPSYFLIFTSLHAIRSRVLSVSDPLQRSRLKVQFAFCLGIRCASHVGPIINRIRTTVLFQSILN